MKHPVISGCLAAAFAVATATALADDGVGQIKTGVPAANQHVGTPATVVDPDFQLKLLATGTDALENPNGVITKFGLLSTNVPTEPDENLYLVLDHNPGGPTAGFDYGRHFLYQGHENGSPFAYVTRINLDVPRGSPQRITLLTPGDSTGNTGFGSIDGDAYNPFTNTLLFTQEAGANGGVIQLTIDWPVQVNTLYPFLGRAGFEGIKLDDKGNIYIVEDTGGTTTHTPALNNARQPNSFVYRYVPNNPQRIEDGGRLQALQVIIDGQPIVFGGTSPAAVDADISSDAQLKLHTAGTSFPIRWVTVHTANAGDTAPFNANAAAKTAGATPFKRPENMAWLPGSDFRTFFFDPTGDTDAIAGDNSFLQARGSYGSIFRVDLREDGNDDGHAATDDGRISLFFLGDREHNSFDNLAFASEQQLLAAEDRGDTLHGQLNTLDSIWAFDVHAANKKPIRFLALGRDASAVVRGEDNEPTGVFVSNGSSGRKHMLGTAENLNNARGFFTMQHGDNNVFEFVRTKGN
jgi:Alkaline phosphatase PhoX